MVNQHNWQRALAIIGILCLMGTFIAACHPLTPTYIPDTPSPTEQTSTPTATRVWFPSTATPTIYVPPTETPTPDVSPGFDELAFKDDFSDHSSWLTGSYAGGNVAYGEGTLNLSVASPGGSLTSFRKDTYFSDFYEEITITANLCSPTDTYGLTFWSVNGQNYHQLSFNCSGEFSIEKVKSGRPSQLLDLTPSSQVPRGGLSPFRVGLWVGDGLIRVYLNGQYQTGIYIPHATGGIGIFAHSAGGPAVSVSYSDMQMYLVSPVDYPPTPTPTLRPTNKPYPTLPTP
jgi:hypothetical protein